MAFEHLVENENGNHLAPSGVVLSGPLPAVLCFGPDSEFVLVNSRYWERETPVWTGENIGGADMVDTNTAVSYTHLTLPTILRV